MVGDKDDRDAETEYGGRDSRVADRCQVQGGGAEDNRRTERDHRKYPSQYCERHGMRQAGDDIGDTEQDTLSQPHKHQAVYGAEHSLDHVSPDPLALSPQKTIAQFNQPLAQRGAIAEQEEQGEQGETEEDQS